MKALHANDGKEVVSEKQYDDGWSQPWIENDGCSKYIPEALFHSEQREQSRQKRACVVENQEPFGKQTTDSSYLRGRRMTT